MPRSYNNLASVLSTPFTSRFWFVEGTGRRLAQLRIAIGAYQVFIFLISYPNWENFYGPFGVSPLSLSLGSDPHVAVSIFSISASRSYLWFLYVSGLCAAIFMTLGFLTRTSTVWLFILSSSMMHRVTTLVNGQDQVMVMLLFVCCFADLRRTLSVDEWIRSKRRKYSDDLVPLWPLRLIQVWLCLLYFCCGPSKVFVSEEWLDGSAFYFVSLSDRWFRFNQIEFFHGFFLSKILTWGTVVVETVFPFIVWIPRFTLVATVMMIVFHICLMILMGPPIFYFNLAMCIALISFFPESKYECRS